jgi:hypothetical protein
MTECQPGATPMIAEDDFMNVVRHCAETSANSIARKPLG